MHVTFTFMARGDLPLAAVWEGYFSGCEAGSYGIVVHTHNGMGNTSGVFRGAAVPHPVEKIGHYNYSVVRGMYEVMAHALNQNNNTDYVQFLSDRSAPVRTCLEYFEFIRWSRHSRQSLSQSYFGYSDLRHTHRMAMLRKGTKGRRALPPPRISIPVYFEARNDTPFFHSTQWMTLSVTHIRYLQTLNQSDLQEKYTSCVGSVSGNNCIPEETVFANEILRKFGESDVNPRTLTWSSLTDSSSHDNNKRLGHLLKPGGDVLKHPMDVEKTVRDIIREPRFFFAKGFTDGARDVLLEILREAKAVSESRRPYR